MGETTGNATIDTISRYRDRIVEGPVLRTLLWLGLPLMIVQLVHVSYNVADAYWLSKYSDTAMAVPRQAWPPFMLFNALSIALSSANLALISQYIGAKRFSEASSVASKFFTVSVLTGIAFGLSYIFLRPWIFTYIVAVPKEIYSDVLAYAGIIAIDMMIAYVVLTYSTILQSIGDTRRPAIVNGLSALMNIVLDPFLILGIGFFPKMGVIGAAVATVLSRAAGAIGLVYIVKKSFPELRIRFTKDIDLEWVTSNLRIGLPVFIFFSTNSLAFMMLLRLVNTFGVVAATAYSIGFIVMDLSNATLWGLSRASAIMVGQNLGAGKTSKARDIAIKSALMIFASSLAGASIVFLFRDQLIHVFTNDPTIWFEAKIFLEAFIWSIAFFGVMMVAMSVGRGSGHTLVPTIIGIIRLWGIRVGVGYLLAIVLGWGTKGIWTAMAWSNFFAGALSIIWLSFGKWTKPVIKTVPKKRIQVSEARL